MKTTLQEKIDAMACENVKYVSPESFAILSIINGAYACEPANQLGNALYHFTQWHGDWKVYTPFELSEELAETLEEAVKRNVDFNSAWEHDRKGDIETITVTLDYSSAIQAIKSKLPKRGYSVEMDHTDYEGITFTISRNGPIIPF